MPRSMVVGRRPVLLGGLVSAFSRRAEASDLSFDERARFLAGLAPLPGTTSNDEWKAYAVAEDERWKVAASKIRAMTDWSAREVGPLLPPSPTLFYPFGGPDAMHALSLFPTARRSILVGLEPVGVLPDPRRAPPGFFTRLGAAMNDLFRLSFFRTKEMGADFERDGVLAALVVIVARLGGRIVGVRTSTAPDAARIDWVHPDGQPRRLEYIRTDLANAALVHASEFLADVRSAAPVVTFVKAAMYLLGETRFSRTRQLVLDDSAVVVQDDTGVPFRHFDARWALKLFGRYEAPVTPFADRAQGDLRAAFERRTAGSLPFGIGYHVRPDRSNLMIASKGAG